MKIFGAAWDPIFFNVIKAMSSNYKFYNLNYM